MRISTEALPRQFEPAVNWISGLIGAALNKRIAGFEQQERTNPLLGSYFRENFTLEFALAKARKYRKSTGRLPRGEEYDRLCQAAEAGPVGKRGLKQARQERRNRLDGDPHHASDLGNRLDDAGNVFCHCAGAL